MTLTNHIINPTPKNSENSFSIEFRYCLVVQPNNSELKIWKKRLEDDE